MSDVSLPAINLLDVRIFSNSSRPNYIMRILNYAYTYNYLACKVGIKGLWIENDILPNTCKLWYPMEE